MNGYSREVGHESMCADCGGHGHVMKICPRCGGTGEDPSLACMSAPCIECRGSQKMYYLCSHLLLQGSYAV